MRISDLVSGARPPEGRRRGRAALLAALLTVPALYTVPALSGTRYGDAVPGIIRPSDLEAIRWGLHLDHFSVIAAVLLGAEEGREAIIAEPLPPGTLQRVKAACDGGGFCPDPDGFVAKRVLIVRLHGRSVGTILTVDKEARGAQGALVDLRALGVEGDIVGWNGRADSSNGHVALSLTPMAHRDDGGVGAGLDPPLLIRYNPGTSRFQVFDCVEGENGEAACDFKDEPGD